MDMMENLIVSWLKHIKRCSLIESNYKMSMTVGVKEATEKLYKKIKKDLPSNKLETLFFQTEIDVVGLCKSNSLFVVETAYHEKGIVYGKNTVKSILDKFRRISLLVKNCFKFKKINILFVGNKLSEKCLSQINDGLKKLKKATDFNYQIIVNDDFLNEVLSPLVTEIDNIIDHNESNVRMLKLLKSFDLLR